ncbi:MAG: aminotransferase class V-fold PLP-dependent enzyme [Terriglobia bacterium]
MSQPRQTLAAVDWREEFWDFENRIYLDCANQGPFPKTTIRAVEQALALKKYPERITNELYFELPRRTRAALARLIGAQPTEIALTSGASDGVNAVARGLAWEPGDEILLPAGEFPANYYPWKNLERRGVRVRAVKAGAGRFLTADDLLAQLSERTRLLATSYVSYADSNRLDLARLGAACRARGIHLLVDASQAVGALAFTVGELACDFLVGCGYKWLLSPYGTGFFYLRQGLIDHLEVGDIRWLNVEGAENFNRLPRADWRLAPGARRWDATEVSSFLNLSAMRASVEFLLRVGVAQVEAHAGALSEYLIEKLPRDRCVLRSPRAATQRGPFVCVAARTAEKTRELWQALRSQNVFVSLRQDALRIGPNIYNREWEIDRLLAVLAE